MLTAAVVVVISTAAVALNFALKHRRPDAPTAPKFAAPQQLDRSDFASVDSPWLLVLFGSKTCMSCLDARSSLQSIDLSQVQMVEVEVETNRDTHQRYGIDAVPTVVLADHEGVVRWSYLGAPPPELVREAFVEAGIMDDGTDGTPVSL